MAKKGKVVSLEDRLPKLKQQRKKKANRRLMFLLSLFFLLTFSIFYLQSPYSRVGNIQIHGETEYSKEEIIEKSGLTKKIFLWKIDEQLVEKKLKEFETIKSVNVEVQFINTVHLYIETWDKIAVLMKGDHYYPILENGFILDEKYTRPNVSGPILINFDEGKKLEEMINGLKALPIEITNSISEIQYTPKETDPFHIKLFMNDGYEVHASIRTLPEKMQHYPSIVSELDPNVKGIIDLEVGTYFRAYPSEGDEEKSEQQ